MGVGCGGLFLCGIPLRHPKLRIALSEGGASWVPALIDRLEYVMSHSGRAGNSEWAQSELTPVEALHRNFWFCMLDDPSAIALRERIGIDRLMLETDYPHADSTWPNTQDLVAKRFIGVPPEDVARITHRNASELFRHPLPVNWRGAR